MTKQKPFHFPHYLFFVLFLVFHTPVYIVFSYFIKDWAYVGRASANVSITSMAVALAISCIQCNLFRRQLFAYLMPEHSELYARLTAKKSGVVFTFPIGLCRWTFKWEETDPALDSVYFSLLQFGNSARLMIGSMMIITFLMNKFGYSAIYY